jgi:hypothetical protein
MSQLADIGVTGLAGVSGFIQPKYLMAAAMLTIALAMYHFSGLSPGAGFAWFATARVYQMAVLPVLFLTITSFSYVGLPPEKSSQASALINVARNLGGSIGVSTAQTILVRRGQFHQSHLSEHIFPSSVQFRETCDRSAPTSWRVAARSLTLRARPLVGLGGRSSIEQPPCHMSMFLRRSACSLL